MEKLFKTDLNVKRLETPDDPPECTDEGTVHRLTEADISVVSVAHRDKELVQRRLAEGCMAYWLEIDGACAAVVWVATERYYVWDIRADILLPPDSIYLFDAHTVPEFRKRRLMKKCRIKCFESLKEKGLRKAYVLIRMDNTAANVSTERGGYELLGVVSLLQIPPVRRYSIQLADGQRRGMLRLMRVRNKPAVLNLNELRFEK